MSKLKRIPIKYVRDRAKSRYQKDCECYICQSRDILDFHHFHTVDILFDDWLKKNKIVITSADDVIAVRDRFIEEHSHEMFDDAITLCKKHHKLLHTVYGQRPPLSTAPKQRRWVEKQRLKNRT